MSGVGKGIAASSLGKILQFNGFEVSAVKIDPYVNVDAGTMNPTEHGEVFVLDDGYECDQDMGNYERFLNKSLTRDSYMTTGSVYQKVIAKERALGYKGKCVDVVPDVPLAVLEQIKKASELENADITIIEIGGTLGEYQNVLFLEAARILKIKRPKDVAFVLVSYLPTPKKIGEMKTKPTQYAVRTMGQTGLFPDIIIGRSEIAMDKKRKEKIALSCSMSPEDIISAPDVDSVYDVPENFLKEKLDKRILKKLGLKSRKTNKKALSEWQNFIKNSKKGKKKAKIAVVGKYFDTGDFVLSDAYLSVIEALKYSAYSLRAQVQISWINSKNFEGERPKMKISELSAYDALLVPGGFGKSGIEGKLEAIKYARVNKIPFLGICYGMQLATIEFARNVCGLSKASSAELDPKSPDKIIDILDEQKEKIKKGDFGGSMRLGAYPAVIKPKTLAESLYKTDKISERHRHRYELNPKYKALLEEKGMMVSASSPDGTLAEIVELKKSLHPFFIASQFHPEFQARPLSPHPLFVAFVKEALKSSKK